MKGGEYGKWRLGKGREGKVGKGRLGEGRGGWVREGRRRWKVKGRLVTGCL